MIKLKNISKIYGDKYNELIALNDINLKIENKKLTAIIGKSGSGKSTLMNIVGALDKTTKGEVIINNQKINDLNEIELSNFRNKNTGFIFQSFYLEPSFTVFQNIEMPLIISGVSKKERIKKIESTLISLDIFGKKDKKVNELSSGEKQRVCIARAIVNDANIILADEPTGNLDSENGENVMNILQSLAKNGKTVILVTHNIEDAKKYADRIIELLDGKIIKDMENNYENK